MKIHPYILIFFLMSGSLFSQTGAYPSWNGSPIKDADRDKRRDLIVSLQASLKFKSIPPDKMFTKGAFDVYLSDSQAVLRGYASGTTSWPLVSCSGKMSLPNFVVQDKFWGPSTNGSSVWYPSTPEDNARCCNYIDMWWMMIYYYPEQAFASLSEECNRKTVETLDLLRLQAGNVYDLQNLDSDAQGLYTMSGHPRKEDWDKLYKSPNPAYRLLAFIHYDKVPLSGEELLKIYEDGLFHSCSFVEMRILVGIKTAHDYRPPVLALVKRYMASNPLADDGTLGKPQTFQSLKDAAQAVLSAK